MQTDLAKSEEGREGTILLTRTTTSTLYFTATVHESAVSERRAKADPRDPAVSVYAELTVAAVLQRAERAPSASLTHGTLLKDVPRVRTECPGSDLRSSRSTSRREEVPNHTERHSSTPRVYFGKSQHCRARKRSVSSIRV